MTKENKMCEGEGCKRQAQYLYVQSGATTALYQLDGETLIGEGCNEDTQKEFYYCPDCTPLEPL